MGYRLNTLRPRFDRLSITPPHELMGRERGEDRFITPCIMGHVGDESDLYYHTT
jgi:hypothetical protein